MPVAKKELGIILMKSGSKSGLEAISLGLTSSPLIEANLMQLNENYYFEVTSYFFKSFGKI